MDVTSEKIIYSYADARAVNLKVLAQEMGTMEKSKLESILKTLNRAQIQELKRLEQQRVKTERLSDRASLKAEKKANKTSFVQKIQEKRATKRASRNAKKLLKLKDKTGKEKVMYPLTRLKRKNNQFVKSNPDGTETIVPKENVIETPKGEVYDKMEIQKVTSIPLQNLTPLVVESSITYVPSAQAPEQAQQTFTPPSENIPFVGVDQSKIGTDGNGDAFMNSDLEFSNKPSEQEETPESTKPNRTWLYVGLGAGVLVIGGIITYFVVNNKNK
jgi:hypothetical protein